MRPGDIIFYSAKLYNKQAKVHAHEMVHVEVFVGGITGKQSIGARRKGGVIQEFDSFKFESKRFYNTVHHYRSLDTWLDGVCKSWCPDHEWRPNKKGSNYYAKIHARKRKEKERAQLNEIEVMDYVESMEKYTKTGYISSGYRLKPITATMEKRGYLEGDRIDQWNYKARLAWVSSLNEIDYARFKIGYHLVNRIPTLYKLTHIKNVIKMFENLKISMRLGYLDTFVDLDTILPEAYILDYMPELWQFLNGKNEGQWDLVTTCYSSQGNVTTIDDVMAFKHTIMCVRPLEAGEISSEEESEEEESKGEEDLECASPEKSTSAQSPSKKPKTFLDPIPNPELNPNMPNLLYKRCRPLKRGANALPNKVIIRQSVGGNNIELKLHILVASVKPYLSLVNPQKCREDLKNFLEEKDSLQSAKSTDLPDEPEDGVYDRVLKEIMEFCRLFTMEMKGHITPVFGCFEFFEGSFLLDSNYNLVFKTIDSNIDIFTQYLNPKSTISKESSKSIGKTGGSKNYGKYIHTVISEGVDIVLQIHQLGGLRSEKSTFKAMLETLKEKKKYAYEYLYTDFE